MTIAAFRMPRGESSRSCRNPVPHARGWPIASTPRLAESTFKGLDHREKNGYERHDGAASNSVMASACEGVVYIAPVGNFAYLGPAPDAEMADQILRSTGPSGTNIDYLLELAAALRDLEIDDSHVFRARTACAFHEAGAMSRGAPAHVCRRLRAVTPADATYWAARSVPSCEVQTVQNPSR